VDTILVQDSNGADRLEDLIIIVGPPGSGKTTAARYLHSLGYTVISAGAVVGRLDMPNRIITEKRQLIERGERMLREQGPKWFAEKLISEAKGHKRVAIDGVRPVATIERILEQQPEARVFYIEVNDALRRKRYKSDQNDVPYDEILQSNVERSAEGAKDCATLISNETTLDDFRHSLKRAIMKQENKS
jgi:dephospho-CoA kinase